MQSYPSVCTRWWVLISLWFISSVSWGKTWIVAWQVCRHKSSKQMLTKYKYTNYIHPPHLHISCWSVLPTSALRTLTPAHTNIRVNIDGCVHICFVIVLQLNAIGIAIIPSGLDLPVSELTNIGLDLVTHLETKLIGHQASLEALFEPIVIEVLPNEYKDALTFRPK